MTFAGLQESYHKWHEILVIGKTIEREGKKYHILGMTLTEEEGKLYIIEPYQEKNCNHRRRSCNQRKLLKEHEEIEICYLYCEEFQFGQQKVQVQGGSAGALKYCLNNYGEVQLFFDMMHAGWVVPEWLKEIEWENLQLVTLNLAPMKKLPKYTSDMPITIKHRPNPIRHIVEKTVTLSVGKKRSFYFVDKSGETVYCYINNVTIVDIWKEMEEQFQTPKYKERFSEEEIEQMKQQYFEVLAQICPKGMCYIGVEYECSKNMSLQFYSKQYLKSCLKEQEVSTYAMLMRLKPDKEFGIHQLPLKGCMVQTPVSPDTMKLPAELFLCFENIEAWEEMI